MSGPRGAARWAVNAVYAALLALLAVAPPSSGLASVATPDWLAHAVAYGLQTGLVFWAIGPSRSAVRRALTGIGTAVAFGAVTEALQVFHPLRSIELADLAANAAGAVVVAAILVVASGHRSRRDE